MFNDDTIAPVSGFGAHSHRDMEIITIVLRGELTHKDSMGNIGTIKAGEVQYMSAGTGVTHAEMNEGDVPVHLYQIWIEPKERALTPTYAQKDFSNTFKNSLVPVASDVFEGEALTIQASATIYTSNLEKGETITYVLGRHRGAFIYLTKGMLTVNDVVCMKEDQLRIDDIEILTITAEEDASFVMIDVDLE